MHRKRGKGTTLISLRILALAVLTGRSVGLVLTLLAVVLNVAPVTFPLLHRVTG